MDHVFDDLPPLVLSEIEGDHKKLTRFVEECLEFGKDVDKNEILIFIDEGKWKGDETPKDVVNILEGKK